MSNYHEQTMDRTFKERINLELEMQKFIAPAMLEEFQEMLYQLESAITLYTIASLLDDQMKRKAN